MARSLTIVAVAMLAAVVLQSAGGPVEAADKKQPRSTSAQKGGDDQGVAWVSGMGGVRGSSKGKAKKAR
jgi:hypothetical protein